MQKITGKSCKRHVVNDAIVGALQERGVDGDHRVEPHGGHAGGEQNRVLLRDAHVEIPV